MVPAALAGAPRLGDDDHPRLLALGGGDGGDALGDLLHIRRVPPLGLGEGARLVLIPKENVHVRQQLGDGLLRARGR